ncbi:MAG TPA: hydroxymethylglutaryl-CoA lyase [Desulfomonilaceae bacterium]|nr:hydroxymethylglutaryl-CoA lyase [Desulfomonilaceae bacterium]
MAKEESATTDKIENGRRVWLQEVGPRDGLQSEPRTLTSEARAELIERLADTGLPRIQIGSFVNPRRVPQMAATGTMWRRLRKKPGTRYSVLALNLKGLDLALAEGIPHVEIYVSASETHSLKNSGSTVTKALKEASRMITTALENGIGVTAGVMCAFGCFYEGPVPIDKVLQIVKELDSSETVEVGLADTPGLADPEEITRVVEQVGNLVAVDRLAVHLHDTRGLGLANLRAALESGVRRFDTSIGGLGGCPFIPGAKGNISTEQTVDALESTGFRTGVDLQGLDTVRSELAQLLGRALPG